MFKMNEKTIEILEGRSLNRREAAAAKRQLVYKYIIKHPEASTNMELAAAAGYNTNVIASPEYNAGNSFIWKMIRDGYIEKNINRDGTVTFYLGTKEPVECEDSNHNSKAIEEAKKVLNEEIEEYEEEQMGPEGQSKEDWATDDPIDGFEGSEDFIKPLSGSINIHSANSDGVSITIEFSRKSRQEIIDIINNINTEFLL